MKKEAWAITFKIDLEIPIYKEETIYMSEKEFDNIPEYEDYHYSKNYSTVISEYFNKEKIEEMKKELCNKIMNTENPFSISEHDIDSYPIEENKIWK